MTYKINFRVWLSNDLNTLPYLVSNSLDETNHHFFLNTMASNCASAHSLVQLTQHLHFVYQRYYFPFFISPYLSPFPAIIKTWGQNSSENCEKYKAHSVSCDI